jgi:3-dehydroquinate dehydratase-1
MYYVYNLPRGDLQMQKVSIRNVEIGGGMPVICLPIVGKGIDDVLNQAGEVTAAAKNIPSYLVEWRIDHFTDVFDNEALCKAGEALKNKLEGVPLLVTFRSKDEGGECDITPDGYKALCFDVIKSGIADMIDVELFLAESFVDEITTAAKAAGVKVIMSNHDFESTPPTEEIIRRLTLMEEKGADICKIAVMPKGKTDVARLLYATAAVYEKSNVPLVTMSMGGIGLISRLSGEAFGSAITFGCALKASAPGQISADRLYRALEIVHDGM